MPGDSNAAHRAVECVVLFADIAESSSLYERMGDEAAYDRIDRALKTMQRVVVRAGGRVLKLTGDGLMAIFERADDAIESSITMGLELGDLTGGGANQISIRIGFQHGPVVATGSDMFGETVNVAARLCELASPGSAVTSADTAALLSPSNREKLRELPPRPLKGINRAFELRELVCDDISKVTAVFPGLSFEFTPASMQLTFNGQTRSMDEGAHRVTVGRDANCDLVLAGSHASRKHCVIEERAGKFVLIDSSSNGTYVHHDDGREIRICREELILSGHGWITFGRPRSAEVEELEFSCSD